LTTNFEIGMSDIESFPPIANQHARILILGSIPGTASLQAQQYYAHPRNQFWTILGELLDFDPQGDYASKTQALLDAGVAVWDVVKSCHRPGSLDTNIAKHTMLANDFGVFFRDHPAITEVFFNGATAEQTFLRLVLSGLSADKLIFHRLPSTSSANAGLNFQQKLEIWRRLLTALNTTRL
jgi:hypoxanthine-DNA glycosylase